LETFDLDPHFVGRAPGVDTRSTRVLRFERTGRVSVSEVMLPSPAMNAAAPTAMDDEEVLFDGRPALVPSLGVLLLVILTVGLWLLPQWWKQLGCHYRVTTRRIVIESGVLSKRMEQVDLYRINDYTVERPFLQRLLGTGNILLRSMDKTTPELNLENIRTDVVTLYERLRKATELDKTRRNARLVDYE
jgi:membrane protein YdbS with pleckstrin-like domain